MSIKAAFHRYCRSHPLIGAQIGIDTASKLHPDLAPTSSTGKWAVFQVISSERTHHMTGPSDLVQAVIQVSCWADAPDSGSDLDSTVEAIADSFRLALDGYPGGSAEWGGVRVECVMQISGPTDVYSNPVDGEAQGAAGRLVEFEISYRQDVPIFSSN